ncbi:MAG: hypothetical protein JNG84_05700 [Archangium sp.]|nr:hypothetical protein [Archangium sp.]
MNRWVVMVVVCGVVGSALATTMVSLDVPALARSSALVVRGTVVRVEARWNGDRTRIFTEAEVQVAEVLKGAPVKSIIVRQPGGEVGDIGQRVHGVARFEEGVEQVLFLERRGPLYTVTGMAQGAFTLHAEGTQLVAKQPTTDELALVDSATHQPVAHAPIAMPYPALVALVRASASTGAPASPTPAPLVTPVAP